MRDRHPMGEPGIAKPRTVSFPVRALALVTAMALGAAGGAWANAVLFQPPYEPAAEANFTTAVARVGSVESSMRLTVNANWEKTFSAPNQASGTVTSIAITPGQELREGDVLFSVDLRPVRIALGSTPSFRALSLGAKGPDVKQLLELMAVLGYYDGTPDESFGSQAQRAVKEYQRNQHLAEDGVIQMGDVVYVPSLPARVLLDSEVISVGTPVSGGERGIATLAAVPVFSIPLSESQATTVKPGSAVEIETGNGLWKATVANQEPSADPASRDLRAILAPISDTPICADSCAIVPAGGASRFSAKLVIQAAVEGTVIPSVAIQTSSTGDTFLIDTAGRRLPVEIVARAKGMTVVSGISPGTRVRLQPSTQTKSS
ncbi:peptidoglycan-binding domain-containing protein [uncultured Leifsonia sp.]|uniref:peptidoglycan-binding domain-containing protein n=1 Tax=uncultured Leifsonia sp. TaxID=340359 RepID=UPI0025CFA851|nr:peptidoglycan-binding domain-containing protein [uncultured Leifsonia sp.]